MKEVTAKIDCSKYRTIFTDGKHQVVGDEPASFGTNEGTDLYSLLLMALSEESNDEGTNALMGDSIREQEKLVWMYPAYLN